MFSHVTFEMSLKPFKKTDPDYIRAVADKVFSQWKPLCVGAEDVSIMLWTADGSEILDYKGNPDEPFEWCKFIGSANPPASVAGDPDGVSLHAKHVLYMENPPVMTYRILALIISELKAAGHRALGDSVGIRIGETFDIGPEFAISEFKYRRHPELCLGMAMGARCFINSYGVMHADDYPYAGFPDGVPEGTPFGTFLGRQCRHFLPDMGFDYLWLSNGVGFSAEPWTAKGAVFDGKHFDADALAHVKEEVFGFWKLFRAECPDCLIETRGTNFSAGIDYSTDAVPLFDLYNAGFGMLAPPNSPWAALDSNFGLELMGHMTRISHLPENNRYLFRYYIHDPWWANSPWYDRYEGQPHDIYLPMALSRTDGAGVTQAPTDFNILSIDNSWGDLPDSCANEPIPHILKAEKDAADAPAPLVWVYPLREFTTATEERELIRMFSNDWFVAEAINNGLPLSSIITTDNFLTADAAIFGESILLSVIPEAGSAYERKILDYAKAGGKVLFYGPLDRAGDELMELLNLSREGEGISGEVKLTGYTPFDHNSDGSCPDTVFIHEMESAGRVDTVLRDETSPVQPVIRSGRYVLGVHGGNVAWYRASASQKFIEGHKYLVPDKKQRFAISEAMIRELLSRLGLTVRYGRPSSALVPPAVMINRSDNGFFFSTFAPSTVIETELRLPDGAPILLGYETVLRNGRSTYRFPRADHRECRVFVDGMKDGIVGCREMTSESTFYRRRLRVTGLADATVTIYPERYCIGDLKITLNRGYPFVASDPFDGEWDGNCLRLFHITGTLDIHMPRTKPERQFSINNSI